MRIFIFLVVFGMASMAQASFFSKAKVAHDAEGNCLPEVVNENARLYGELEALDKIATRSEAQAKSTVRESQMMGLTGFKELSAKTKSTRAAIKKFADAYRDATCKVMIRQKVSTFVVKNAAAALDETAAGFEKMADSYLKPIAKK